MYREDVSWDDVASRVSGFSLGQVLIVLGGVSAILNSYEPIKGQRRVVSALFENPDQVGRDLHNYCERQKRQGVTDPVLFFTEQQVVAIAKIALRECPHVTERSSASFKPIGEALMMVADLIDREYPPSTLDSPADRDAWISYVVRNRTFNTSDNFACSVARAHELYLPEDNGLRNRDSVVNLRERFEEITGLDPKFAWGMGMALLANWRTVDPMSDRPPGPLSLEAYASALRVSQDEIVALTRLFAVDAGEAGKSLREDGFGPDSLQPFELKPLDQSPLVSLDGRLYCPSVRLLRWKLTTGLHHVFLQRSPRNDEKRRSEYLTHAGQAFEEYVEALLRRVFPHEANRYLDAAALGEMIPQGTKACDGIVLYGDKVLLLECKATLLPRGVRAEGDTTLLRSKVASIFGNAAEQFDGTISAIEDGFLGEWVRPSTVVQYLPVVVTLDMLPVESLFHRIIEEAVEGRDALRHAKARPLQVLAIQELELLEEYVTEGGSLADLLVQRIENGSYRDSCMKNYLLARGMRRVLRANHRLQERFRELGERTLAMMRERARGPW